MGEHVHFCSECGLEWRCYDVDCAGAHDMDCEECGREQDLDADEGLPSRVVGRWF